MLKGQGTLKLNVTDVLYTNRNIATSTYDNYVDRAVSESVYRVVVLSLNGRSCAPFKRNNISNDETQYFTSLPYSASIYGLGNRSKFTQSRDSRVASLSFSYRLGSNQAAASRRADGAEEEKRRVGGQQ